MSSAYLDVRTGKGEAKRILVDAKVTIGRDTHSTIELDDTQASRNHCVIEQGDDGFVLRDLKSKNGTRVNGKAVSTVRLAPRDVITIGRTQLTFVVEGEGSREVGILPDEDGEPATPSGFKSTQTDPEKALAELAGMLPDPGFEEEDIELINARSGTMHEAGARGSKGKERREALDLFRQLLLVCFQSRATDIHIEPREEGHQARLRIDGTMFDVMRLRNEIGVKFSTLVKVLSDIDIAHRNTIQEGHFAARVPSPKSPGGRRRVDYRVSFAPAMYGQKLVIRILDTANAPTRMRDLLLPSWMSKEVGAATKKDSGMVLVAGPTGTGKTTTLYALVRGIDVAGRNVVTIEDPVEIQIEGVTQIPVDEARHKGFSDLLRSVLRQDPDVMLVGEIRDSETARIAMRAAITGHMVLSTVHTQDTIGTIFRLLDLGVEPYLVAQGLHVVLAQRLVRKLCAWCKKPVPPRPEQLAAMGEIAAGVTELNVAVGCPGCLGTGFAGRQACFELLRVNDALREAIQKNPTMQSVQAALKDVKFVPLQQSAYQLVAAGVTPFDEVERITGREG